IPLDEYQRENFHLIQDLFSSHYKICIPETECLFLLDLIEISTKQKSIEEIQNFAPSKTVKKAVEVFIQQIQQIINYSFDPLTIKALEAEFDLAIIRSKKEIRVINTLYNDIIQKDPFLFGTVSFLFNSTPELSIFNFNRMDICRFVMIIKNNIDQYFLEYPQITAVLISNTGMDQLFYTKKTIEKYLPFIKIEHFLSPEQLKNSKLAIDIIISFEYLNNPCYPIVYVDYLLTYDKLMSLKSKIQDIVFTRKTLKETTYSSIRLSKRKNYYLDDLKNVLLTYFSDKKYDFNRETMKKVISNSSFVVEDCLYLIAFFPNLSQLEKITFHLKKELIIGMNQVFKVVLFIADLNEIHQFYGRPAILLDIK
ncbi:transcriptional antiterminator BglG, partial [Enterococcus gallinarum]|nr:transcriptional antiterminator BglG [Enterococcus gallinarum]NYS82521.1 transcriptional antiterminator BglG [Enterococcus gallinarum]